MTSPDRSETANSKSKVGFSQFFPDLNESRNIGSTLSLAPSIESATYFQILLAIDPAIDCKDTQVDLWNRKCYDKHIAYAVHDCYHSIKFFLHSLVDGERRLWIKRIYSEINSSIYQRVYLS